MRERRWLVFAMGSLGDTVVSLPVLRGIKELAKEHGARVWMLHDDTPGVVKPCEVLEGQDLVENYLAYPAGRTGLLKAVRMAGLLPRLRTLGFEAVYYLAPSERPAVAVRRDRLFFVLAGIARAFGFHPVPEPIGSLPISRDGISQAYEGTRRAWRIWRDLGPRTPAAVFEPPALRLPDEDLAATLNWLRTKGHHRTENLIAVSPATKQPANRWPLENFVTLGKRVAAEGFCPVVLGTC